MKSILAPILAKKLFFVAAFIRNLIPLILTSFGLYFSIGRNTTKIVTASLFVLVILLNLIYDWIKFRE